MSQTQGAGNRRALSIMEVIVALALLGATVGSIGRFVSNVHRGLRDRELSARMGWEVANLRERVGSWSPDQITAARIEQVAVSAELAQQLSGARWVAQIRRVAEPIEALQIDVALHCTLNGQAAVPEALTFWVRLPSQGLVGTEAKAESDAAAEAEQ